MYPYVYYQLNSKDFRNYKVFVDVYNEVAYDKLDRHIDVVNISHRQVVFARFYIDVFENIDNNM